MRKGLFFILVLFLGICLLSYAEEDDFVSQRKSMVIEQIRARGISDQRVLNAMLKVKRHLFVPVLLRKLAYSDRPLPIGEGQTISQPYIVALMTELAEVKEQDSVLEIGTGSGYQAAILAQLARKVYTIEIIPELAKRAKILLDRLGYENIEIKIGDGYLGWPERAPFDAIIVTAAPREIPARLAEQLAEGGRMVVPVGEMGNQVLKLLVKKQNEIVEEDVIPVIFVPMIHK